MKHLILKHVHIEHKQTVKTTTFHFFVTPFIDFMMTLLFSVQIMHMKLLFRGRQTEILKEPFGLSRTKINK